MTAFLKIRPTERRTPLLSNPHKGCATFQRFNGDALYPDRHWSEEGPLAFPAAGVPVIPGYLPSTVAYCRWFWDVLEPDDGRLDFTMVESALAMAAARGQTLQLRLMPFGSAGQPQLPAWYRSRYPTTVSDIQGKDQPFTAPAYDGPDYFDRWGRVISAFGTSFDGHPALESVDMAFIGPWGEGAGDPAPATVDRFADLYRRAHPRTTLLANTDGLQFPAGIARGMGWRCDCFGDLRRRAGPAGQSPHLAWNHTFDFYPQAVVRAGATDAWMRAPVTFETCATPLTWKQEWFTEPGDLKFILDQGLKFHISIFMPKSVLIPDEYLAPLAEFCDRIGYRFVLRQARWAESIERGGSFPVECWIENTGVAPVYRPYRVALRVRWGTDGVCVLPLAVDPRTWQPGDALVEEEIRFPGHVPAGVCELSLGLLPPDSDAPAIRFAVAESDAAGWIPLGPLRVA